MAFTNTASSAVKGVFAGLAEHVVRAWRDPGLRMVLRREARRFAVTVAKEAHAAWLRT